MTDFATLLRALKDHHIERICHLAALYPDAADANPLRGFHINATATVQILEAARIMGLDRVVFTSSLGALSPLAAEHLGTERKPINEDHPAYPTEFGVYGSTKVASELMGLNYEQLFGIKFIALRFSVIYGPGKHASRHGTLKILWNRIMEHALREEPLRFDNGGDEPYDMVYSRDVAHSVVLGCLAASPEHSVFHIGGGHSHTLREFVDGVKEVIPRAPIEVGPGRADDLGPGGPWIFDTTRAKAELGYEAQYPPREAIRDWLHWLDKLNLEVTPSS